jgi:hypothetical protein
MGSVADEPKEIDPFSLPFDRDAAADGLRRIAELLEIDRDGVSLYPRLEAMKLAKSLGVQYPSGQAEFHLQDAFCAALLEVHDYSDGGPCPTPDYLRLLAGHLARTHNSQVSATIPQTPLQQAILHALDGRALTADALAAEVCAGDRPRLYKGGKKATGNLHELKRLGKVAHRRGVGYYRPDAPPPETK